MIAHLAVQSHTQTFIHNAILFIDTSLMLDTTKFISQLVSQIWRYLLVMIFRNS